MALSRITEAVASFTDLTIGDDLTLTDDLLLASDANIIKFGADAEVTLTHVHNTGLLLNSTSVIQFNDASQNIGAPSATVLDINATDEIELNATLVDVNANLDVNGTIVGASTVSAGTAFVPDAADGATLGTTSLEFSDLFLADGGVINFGNDQDINITHVADTGLTTNGSFTASGTMQGTTITATTAFVPDASDGAALGTTSLEFSDLFLADGAVIALGADQDVTLTHVADTGILVNGTSKIQFNDASQFIHAPSNAVLDLAATDEIELTATLIDVQGNLAVSGNFNLAGNLEVSGTSSQTVTATGSVVPDANDGATLGTANLAFSDLFLADGAVINLGNDEEVKITHVADTGVLLNSTNVIQFRDSAINIGSPADGDLDINADDEIELNSTLIDINGNVEISGTLAQAGVVTMDTNVKLQFRDTGLFINSSTDGQLDIAADTEIQLAATTVDLNGNLDVSGTYTGGGLMTTGGNIVIPNDGNIGSAGDADAMAISSSGVVTFSQNPVFPDGGVPIADLDIDGGTDIGADLTTSDLIVVDDGAGGTNRKAALSRVVTLVQANIEDPTALAIALG